MDQLQQIAESLNGDCLLYRYQEFYEQYEQGFQLIRQKALYYKHFSLWSLRFSSKIRKVYGFSGD